MEAPLVNDYKKSFIIRRLLETFLGGLRLYFSFYVPTYVYLTQIILFAFIPSTCGIFLHLLNSGIISSLVNAAILYGCIVVIYVLFIGLLAFVLQRQKPEKELEQVDSFGDEEVFLFDSWFGPKTWLFLVPPKRIAYTILLNAAVAGVVTGLCLYYLNLEPKAVLANKGLCIGFTVLGLFTLSVGVWPLVVGSPPEPAVFHPLPFDLQDLSRSAHILTCVLIHGVASSYPNELWLFYADCATHAAFAFFSVLWLIGALPPIDAYLLWALERWLVVFLGGSPTASNARLICHSVIGTLFLLALAAMPNLVALFVVSSVVGFILSLNWVFLLSFLEGGRRVHDSSSQPPVPSRRLNTFRKEEIVFYTLLLVVIVAMSVAVHLPHREWYDTVDGAHNKTAGVDVPPMFQPLTIDILWYFLVVLSILMTIVHKLQNPYALVWFRIPHFEAWTGGLKPILLIVSHAIRCGGPFVSLLFIHAVVGRDSPNICFGNAFADSLFVAISFIFIFRQIWQWPEHNLVVLSAYLALEKIGGESLRVTVWGDVTASVKIHLVNLALSWFKGTINRLQTIFLFSVTSVTEFKQRKMINYFLVGLNAGLGPALVILCCFSSVLSFPLFPLFTLPLFMIGFPRPLRFWSYPVGYSANQCQDTIYYEQLTPYVSAGMHKCVLSGATGIVYPGDFFLLRWEDRFLWVQVLETGFVYVTYSLKGLELQETSCHTTEASRVDSIYGRAFDEAFNGVCCNNFFLHCLTPLSTFTAVGYSDTRNVLTGVLDSPDTLTVIKDYYLKTLLYFLLEYAAISNQYIVSPPSSRPSSSISRLGSAGISTRKAYANLPKASRISIRTTSTSASGSPSPSTLSQNGRGSRMAWVSEKRVGSTLTGAVVPQTSIQEEERDDQVIVRPISWDSTGDHSETKVLSSILPVKEHEREFGSYFSPVNESNKDRVIPHINKSSKAKTYVTSRLDSSERNLIVKSSSWSDNSSSGESETETESAKDDFFSMSFPQRPQEIKTQDVFEPPRTSDRHFGSRRAFRRNTKPKYTNPLSTFFAPSLSWIVDLPFDEETLEDLQDVFPLTWFKFLLKHFGKLKVDFEKSSQEDDSHKDVNFERQIEQLVEDDALEESYRALLAVSFLTVLGSDISFPTTSQVLKTFNGELPISKGREWIRSKGTLRDIFLKSYRIAVKLSLDHVLVSPINSWADLTAALEEYSFDWYVGPDKATMNEEGDGLWNQAIRRETPSLFSLGYNDVKGVYTSHMLTLGEVEINVGSLHSEIVRSIWASLTTELLYLTNDDDERYSIQAHPILLRNLTIQAADPPLGYPIYSSPPVSLGVI